MISNIDPLTGDPLPQTQNAGKKVQEIATPAVRTDLSRDEWAALADSKLQELLQTSTGQLLLAAVKESKDRLEGRAVMREIKATEDTDKARQLQEALERRKATKLIDVTPNH